MAHIVGFHLGAGEPPEVCLHGLASEKTKESSLPWNVRESPFPSQPVFCISLCLGPLHISLWRGLLPLPRRVSTFAAPGLSFLVSLFFVSPFGCPYLSCRSPEPVRPFCSSTRVRCTPRQRSLMDLPSALLFRCWGRENLACVRSLPSTAGIPGQVDGLRAP